MAYEPEVMHKALARLERRRDQADRRRFLREQELYAQAPRLRELDAALRGTMADLAKLATSGRPVAADGPELTALRTRNEALQKERAQLLTELGVSLEELDPTPICLKCGDRGWTPEGRMCTCLREMCAREQIQALTALLNLTDEQDFDKLRLDVYSDAPWQGASRSPREQMGQIIQVCERFSRQFPDFPLKNLLLSGGTGLGKTFLSGCIAREVSRRGYSVVYDSAVNLFAAFKDQRFARDAGAERQARDDTRRYLNCDLLILDDLGSEFNNALSQAALYEVVNGRLQSGRHTIISTNLSVEGLGERYGLQVASRIGGLYRELTFYGDDLRLVHV